MIRTCAVAILWKERMQRVQTHDGEAIGARRLRDLRQRGEIADALIAVSTQAVELEAQACRARFKPLRPITSARRHRQIANRRFVTVESERVTPYRQRLKRSAIKGDGDAVTGAFFLASE